MYIIIELDVHYQTRAECWIDQLKLDTFGAHRIFITKFNKGVPSGVGQSGIFGFFIFVFTKIIERSMIRISLLLHSVKMY